MEQAPGALRLRADVLVSWRREDSKVEGMRLEATSDPFQHHEQDLLSYPRVHSVLGCFLKHERHFQHCGGCLETAGA